MYDHIGLKVKDIDASIRFYEAALAPLGFVRDGSGFGPKGAPALWLYEDGGKSAGTHVAFAAKDHGAVDRFHKAGVKAGGKDNGAPGLRADYSPKYYAAFLVDPDGNNVEAVCVS
ncbi:MAG TPA: VOC family protein [Rhodanobacteraceae bacterium]|nr:VOC family protein [Rhodanobacteraceae bacterium]